MDRHFRVRRARRRVEIALNSQRWPVRKAGATFVCRLAIGYRASVSSRVACSYAQPQSRNEIGHIRGARDEPNDFLVATGRFERLQVGPHHGIIDVVTQRVIAVGAMPFQRHRKRRVDVYEHQGESAR